LDILKLNKLNNIQISDISELAQLCGNYNPYYEDLSITGETCFLLCYEDKHLVSFLSFLSVESAMESEITAMTLPSRRRQGLFSTLLECALTQLNILGITNIYCAVPLEYQNSSLCKDLSHIEYLQKLDIDSSSELFFHKPKHLQFTYTPSEESDIPTAYHLIEKHFLSRSKEIGICQLSEELQFTNLWGVEIKKPYRNQGYGLKFMSFIINDYFKCTSKPLILNVSSKNTYACKLYNRCGFKIVEQIEYYSLIYPYPITSFIS